LEQFKYQASDGYSLGDGTLAITIAAPQRPVAVNDLVRVDDLGHATGNVLGNDYDPNADTVYLRVLGGLKVGPTPTHINGAYGDLYIDRDGSFTYAVDHTKTDGLTETVKESFYYKISDGSLQDTGALAIMIDPHVQPAGVLDLLV
jgi:autoaggregation protein RapA/B/C